jgi:hypothetical protein
MNTVCCNKLLILFAHINDVHSVTTSYYHCDTCSSNYVSVDDFFITADDIEPSPLVKSFYLDEVYKVYQRLYNLYKEDSDIDINSYTFVQLE